jgi:hypothetical protein
VGKNGGVQSAKTGWPTSVSLTSEVAERKKNLSNPAIPTMQPPGRCTIRIQPSCGYTRVSTARRGDVRRVCSGMHAAPSCISSHSTIYHFLCVLHQLQVRTCRILIVPCPKTSLIFIVIMFLFITSSGDGESYIPEMLYHIYMPNGTPPTPHKCLVSPTTFF